MPANLTPDYTRAEDRLRRAATDAERLDALQEMLRTIPKHKGTEKMQADIKHRLSKLRKTVAGRSSAKGPDPFHVPKGGAGQVVLVGPPNVGKSMLLARTTNAPAKVAEYPFTTALPVPGMARFEDAQIQLVDTPPVVADHVPGGLIGTIRSADVICIVVDLSTDPLEQVEMVRGLLASRGMSVRSAPRNELGTDDAGLCSGVIVGGKSDLGSAGTLDTLRDLYGGDLEIYPVSAETGQGLSRLIERLWQLLAVIRVYTKQPGKPPDFTRPFTLDAGSTVADLAARIHRDLPTTMKSVRLWGHVRFDGQQVHRTELLRDRDVVEIHE